MIECWLADSLRRFYPRSETEPGVALQLNALRGERISFQMVCRTGSALATIDARVEAPAGIGVRVRRIGYVPMAHIDSEVPADEIEGLDHLPGFVPDPLLPESRVSAGPFETNSFWISLHIDAGSSPGNHQLDTVFSGPAGEIVRLPVTLTIHDAQLPARERFPVTNWFYANALFDWYQVEPWSERFWTLLDAYFVNLVEHGQDTIYTPIFTPPLDGEKRPTQLVGVERQGDTYAFDWTHVRRWIAAARAAGLAHFEWSHLFSQWGVAHAIRIYARHGETGAFLWPTDTAATSPVYRAFLSQLLPEFERFLRAEGVLEQSFFHLSDEPHGVEHLANYRAARELVRELAPWMPIMDALSDIEYAREGLTDLPVALLPAVPAFNAERIPVWAYYCNQPRGRFVNRFLDTPLTTIRLTGWLLYATGVNGFLHWGYNSWYAWHSLDLIDPFQITDAHAWPRWTYGDPFVVYPGPEGPLDSIRWELLAESLQDYALLQAAGVTPDDPLLDGIVDFETFPRGADWIRNARAELLKRLS